MSDGQSRELCETSEGAVCSGKGEPESQSGQESDIFGRFLRGTTLHLVEMEKCTCVKGKSSYEADKCPLGTLYYPILCPWIIIMMHY